MRSSSPSSACSTEPDAVRELAYRVFPADRAWHVAALGGGLSNESVLVRLVRGGDVVLRFFRRDPRACALECTVLALMAGDDVAPEVLFAAPDAAPVPFIVYRYVAGPTASEMCRNGTSSDVAQAAFAAGFALAKIGRYSFDGASPFRAEIGATSQTAPSLAQFLAACATSGTFEQRIATATIDRMLAVVDRWTHRLTELHSRSTLVHGDFSRSNVVLRDDASDRPKATIIDWEFACSGSPLFDVGHFLRYEKPAAARLEPHFSSGFVAGGGTLPDDWRELSRLLDLAGIAGGLTKSHLPAGAAAELAGLLSESLATL